MNKVIAISHFGSKSYITHTLACKRSSNIEDAVVFDRQQDLDMALEVLGKWLEEQGSLVREWRVEVVEGGGI